MFSAASTARIARGILTKGTPLYVQFYITARCNLTCEQCNIIYANSDVREATLPEIEKIAENLAEIGVAIVLLTGGEPFVRQDLPEIVKAFVSRGIHVRMQTNGLASEEALAKCVENGGHDISISLDSLDPVRQDAINGGFPGSWRRALGTISKVTKILPSKGSFSAFGCVMSHHNLDDIESVIRFGSEIGWYTSLVPLHTTSPHKPMNFRTYDSSLAFRPEHYAKVDAVLDKAKALKKDGYLLYDSDEYLDDIKRFVRNDPTLWRSKNGGVCDSPGLYFAILPNGDFAVCCDHRLPGRGVPTQGPDFPKQYRDGEFRKRVLGVTEPCVGCMFGSYPEITITARWWSAAFERLQVFLAGEPKKNWPLTAEQIEAIAAKLRPGAHA